MSGNRFLKRTNKACAMVVFALAFGLGAMTPDSALANGYDNDLSIVRGGRLYDNWYKELNVSPPEESHPSYSEEGKFADDPGSNWLCSECHGWDYKGRNGVFSEGMHYTGIIGIRRMVGKDPAKIVEILQDETHGYGDLDEMKEQDILDLAIFVSAGQVDMDMFIDGATGLGMGEMAESKDYFETICAICHGLDGQKMKTMPPLGKVTTDNPWRALGNILNGHSGKTMPALRVFGTQTLIGLLSYIQSLPSEPTLASIARGGRLYDNWYREIGTLIPTEPNPAYPPDMAYAESPISNWRCKECHGWDYLGKDGAYSKGRHFTGIKGIRSMAGADLEEIMDVLMNDTHGYAKLRQLKDRDFFDLANFVSKGQVDMEEYIDAKTGKAKGDNVLREDYYKTICANCHGLDGHKIIKISSLGDSARNDPWKTLHIMLNGHPRKNMPALRALDEQVIIDLIAYLQSLPKG